MTLLDNGQPPDAQAGDAIYSGAFTVPAAVTLSNEPAYVNFPRSLTERVCTDLRHWNTPGRGGHFMSHEEPEQVASELRTFFRPLRTGWHPSDSGSHPL